MRKLIFASLLFAFSASSFAQKNEKKTEAAKKNVVKINPLGFIWGVGTASYERAVKKNQSIAISPTFGFFSRGYSKYTIFGLSGEYRLYLSHSKDAPAGMYFSPGLGYISGTLKYHDIEYDANFMPVTVTYKDKVSGVIVKALLGHQWCWSSGFCLDLNAGFQYLGLNEKDNNGYSDDEAFKGILPALSVSFGFNF
jgi:hypothetical protein